jgi:hypothetical protein
LQGKKPMLRTPNKCATTLKNYQKTQNPKDIYEKKLASLRKPLGPKNPVLP